MRLDVDDGRAPAPGVFRRSGGGLQGARTRQRRDLATAVYGEGRVPGRLVHDAADGAAVNPDRARCEVCGRRRKFCGCSK